MADPDDHAAAVEFESTYDVMFYVGNPTDENKASNNATTTNVSNNVASSETRQTESHIVTKKEIKHTSSKSKVTEIKQSSGSSGVSETMSVETRETKTQSNKEKIEETVTYSNGPNTDNGSGDRNTPPSASVSNRSSRSPKSPASPTTLSPQSPTHWSISARTSPSASSGPSPRSTSPASPGSPVQIKVTSEEIMEAYAKQEKTFQEVFLNQASPMMLKTPPRTRSPSHSPSRKNVSVGIDHLDNLVRLMEQLSSLKEENTSLRKKCAYLEDTKTLLKVQNEMLLFRKELARSLKHTNNKPVRTRSKRLQKGHQNRPPLDMRSMSIIERRGSDTSIDDISLHSRERSGSGKRGLRDKRKIETVFSRQTITSKWNRVKKVFSGKPETGAKTETSSATAEQLVRANTVSKQPSKAQKEGSIGGSSSQESADSKTRTGGSSSASGEHAPPSPSSLVHDATIPSLVAGHQNVYEEIETTEQRALEAECNVVSTSRGSSFGSDESNHDTIKTTMTTTTNSNKQQLKTPMRDEDKKSFHHSTSSPSPQYLTVESQPRLRPRRQSTPNPHMTWTEEDLELIEKIELEPPRSPRIGRSSSFKAAKRQNSLDVSTPGEGERARTRSPDIKKSNRTGLSWGRVKDIIHTRKDSLKAKNKRSNSAGDMLPDASEFEDYSLNYDSPNSSASQPPSPKSERRGSVKPPKSPRSSPPRKRLNQSPVDSPTSSNRQDSVVIAGSPVNVSALMGGMSEEFAKKMQEWEDKKRKGLLSKDNSLCGDEAKFNEEFIKKMEEWERMKGLEQRPIAAPATSRPEPQSPPGGTTPTRELDGSQTQMDVLSESFSKRVQEWERIKTKRIKEGGSPTPERRGRRESRKSRKPEARSKSRERDRSRNKYEKQKERERQKIEKKEKLLERERLKLEKMKHKLETVEILSEAKAEGVTSEFARKLHEWEVMKGLKPSSSAAIETSLSLKTSSSAMQLNRLTVSHQRSSSAKEYKDNADISHQRSNSAKDHKEQMALQRKVERDRTVSEGTDLSFQMPSPTSESSPLPSTGGRSGGTSPQVIDDSTSIDINITAETVAKLEEQNKKLLSEVSEKDEEVAALQDDVTQLTGRINEMNIEQNQKVDHYKRELWAASRLGRYTIETDLVTASMNEIEKRLQQLHSNQRMLVAEKTQLQLQLKQLILARQAVESRIVQQIQETSSNSDPQKLETGRNLLQIHSDFEKLCEFFLKIQSQLGELKLGLAERNQLLLDMQRHLLNHEVTNRLLEANVQRKDLELQYYKEKDHRGIIKRSRSFTGSDLNQRPEHLSRRHPKRYIPQHAVHEDYESTVNQMQTVTITEVEEAYWEWLERLKRQRAVLSGSHIPDVQCDEAQTDIRGLDMKEVGAQTVMTLCNIAYASPGGSPIARLPSSPPKVNTATSPGISSRASSSQQHPLITKARALEMSKSPNVNAGSFDTSQDKVNGTLSTESTLSGKDPSVALSDAPIRPPRRAKLIRWDRKASTDDSLSSHKSEESSKAKDKAHADSATPPSTSSPSTPGWSSPSTPSSANRDSKVESSFTFTDEPQCKPPISPTRRKRSPGVRRKGNSIPEKPQSPTKTYSISVPYPTHDKSPNMPRAKDISVKGESDAKTYLAKLDDALNSGHEETYAEYKLRTSCPPHSPMIRSKYQRKIKAAEHRASNYNGDSSTWQATPPRRLIRHRKVSSEKRPDISSLIEGDLSVNVGRIAQHDDHDQAWRNRALSDSHPALTKDSLSVPSGETAQGHYVFKYQRDQKQLPVSDVISKFERQSLHGSSGEVFRKSPSPGAIGRPTVSPVRRLKTAEELLQEYTKQRRSSAGNNMDRLSPGRDQFPSTSSDKENDKQEKSVIKTNNSDENTPENVKDTKGIPKPGAFVSQAIRKLSVPDSSDQKPPLQDMTNDTHKKEMQKTVHKSADPRLKDLPRLGIVSKQAGIFQAKIGAESRQTKRPAPIPPGGIDYSIKSNSSLKSSPNTSLTDSPISSDRNTRSPERPTPLYPLGATIPTSSPQSSRSKGYSRFFARKVSPSSPPTNKNAISTLCKQALRVEIDSPEPAERGILSRPADDSTAVDQAASPDRRRAKNKFLDSNWLQKPRRFFKVSKC